VSILAWNPSPKVASARDIGKRFKKDMVIVLMIDYEQGTLESVSYGTTPDLCDKAKQFADVAYDAVIKALT